MCQFSVPHLISGSIEQTLLSGLPVLIELQPILISNNRRQLTASKIKYRLSYDIWEDLYAVASARKTSQYPSLSSINDLWNPYPNLTLYSLEKLQERGSLEILLKLRIILLTRTQSQKIKDWIFNSEETEENMPAMDRDAGFKLNLNRLVSLFLNKEDIAENYTIQRKTTKFNLNNLPVQKHNRK